MATDSAWSGHAGSHESDNFTRPSEKEWSRAKDAACNLYVSGGMTLSQMMQRIEESQGWRATRQQWKRKLKQWGIHKYQASQMSASLREEMRQYEISREDVLQDPKILHRVVGIKWSRKYPYIDLAAREKIFRNFRRQLKREAQKMTIPMGTETGICTPAVCFSAPVENRNGCSEPVKPSQVIERHLDGRLPTFPYTSLGKGSSSSADTPAFDELVECMRYCGMALSSSSAANSHADTAQPTLLGNFGETLLGNLGEKIAATTLHNGFCGNVAKDDIVFYMDVSGGE
ncbi:MAG: hypothetical protein Q9227_005101 [Pyrenula ochraceoflavens]